MHQDATCAPWLDRRPSNRVSGFRNRGAVAAPLSGYSARWKKGNDVRQTTSRIYRWQFGEAEFDESKWEFRLRGQMLSLEPRPLEVLGLLLRRA